MIAHLVLATLLGALATGPETPASERSPMTESTVTVVGVGPKPTFDSGYVMATVLVLGQSADGDVDPYYLIHFSAESPVPAVGARCTLWHSDYPLEVVGGLEIPRGLKGQVFSRFECSAAQHP